MSVRTKCPDLEHPPLAWVLFFYASFQYCCRLDRYYDAKMMQIYIKMYSVKNEKIHELAELIYVYRLL